jgi:hypothetical protein
MITTIVSYDGHTFAPDYEAGFVKGSEPRLPDASIALLERIGAWPVIGALQRKPRRLALVVHITGSDRDALRSQLFQWFDPEDEEPKTLVGENHAGISMSVQALCEELRVYGDQQHDVAFVATLAIHGDVRWRAITPVTDTWNVTASGQTRVLANAGEDDAYPSFGFTPTAGKTGSWLYKCWWPILWRTEWGYNNYPTDIADANFDTGALVTAGKMRADRDDLYVVVDGILRRPRLWYGDPAHTKMWMNLDFLPQQLATLRVAIAGAGAVDTIEVNESTSGFPGEGILLIEDEAFTYTGKNDQLRRFSGVTRAVRGTVAAAHLADEDVHWIQHDIWVLYGDPTGLAGAGTEYETYPTPNYQSSTNQEWIYSQFGDWTLGFTAPWIFSGRARAYTDNHGADVMPAAQWDEMGLAVPLWTICEGMWSLHNPCLIGAVDFSNGEKWAVSTTQGDAQMEVKIKLPYAGGFMTEYEIPWPNVAETWQAWSYAGALTALSTDVAIYLNAPHPELNQPIYLEVDDVTLTLDVDHVPLPIPGAEQSNYALDVELENLTTGESMHLFFVLWLTQEIELDTDAKTVIFSVDGSSQFQALTLTGGMRRNWLPLQPGNNTIRFTDDGTNAVTVQIDYEERYY